jgi:hypothetical protein
MKLIFFTLLLVGCSSNRLSEKPWKTEEVCSKESLDYIAKNSESIKKKALASPKIDPQNIHNRLSEYSLDLKKCFENEINYSQSLTNVCLVTATDASGKSVYFQFSAPEIESRKTIKECVSKIPSSKIAGFKNVLIVQPFKMHLRN